MFKLKQSIATENEIAKKVCERLGDDISEQMVKKILRKSLEYAETLTEKDGVYAIDLPYLGYLLFQSDGLLADYYVREKTGRFPKATKYLKMGVAVKKYREIIAKDLERMLNPDFYIKSKHRKTRIVRKEKRRDRFMADLEEMQNITSLEE